MTEAVLAAHHDALTRFLLPLLTGGRVEVERPIGAGAAADFATATSLFDPSASAIGAALLQHANRMVRLDIVPWPSVDLWLFAIAIYDFFVLTDPLLAKPLTRRAIPRIETLIETCLDRMQLPSSIADAATRHAIWQAANQVSRVDVVVRNWAYTYRFFGRPVPGNVVAMPRLRRVTREEHRRGIDQVIELAGPETRSRLSATWRAIRSRSPISELHAAPAEADFAWSLATLGCVSSSALRAALARTWVENDERSAAHFCSRAFRDPALVSARSDLVELMLAMHLEAALRTRRSGGRDSRIDPVYPAVLIVCLQSPSRSRELAAFLGAADLTHLRARAQRAVQEADTAALRDACNMVHTALKSSSSEVLRRKKSAS